MWADFRLALGIFVFCAPPDAWRVAAGCLPLSRLNVSRQTGDRYFEEMADQGFNECAASGRPTADLLETFENPHPKRDYLIETVCPEFTSLCPKTGQPDFGTITISYVPDRLCFELKSLKLYLQQYRSHGAFYEDVANRILDDLVAATRPRSMKITAAFTPRGGIRTNVHVEYRAAP